MSNNSDFENNLEEAIPEENSAEEVLEEKPPKKRKINMHLVLIFTLLIVFGLIYYRISHWGIYKSQDEIFKDGQGSYSDTLDMILPLMDEEGMEIKQGSVKGMNILVFGNAPFADDRDSKDSMEAIFEEMSGANIINCSIGASYQACEAIPYDPQKSPMDIFAPYWFLINKYTDGQNDYYLDQGEAMLSGTVLEEVQNARRLVKETDFTKLDMIVFMYDATDYLLGHGMYSDEYSSDVTTFTGCLEATVDLIQEYYPNIRIIVMSPPYAFSDVKDENGEYISSDITRYGWDVLSTYVIKEYSTCALKCITFVDNLYGTITEENAKEYLIDNLHLNVEGRRLLAKRLLYAIEYVNR